MSERDPIPNSAELLRRISTWSSEADWTAAESKAALRDGGVDPERLVQRVVSDIKPLLSPNPNPQPLLVTLREHTQLAPSAIAEAMEVPVTFLSVVSRHPTAVPASWRQELSRRANRRLNVAPQVVLDAFTAPFQVARAASRDAPYTAEAVTDYEDLLERAGLSQEEQQFWRTIAAEETS